MKKTSRNCRCSKEMLPEKSRTPSRDTIASIIMITNAFVWYFFISEMLKDVVTILHADQLTALSIWGFHLGGIAFSGIIGTAFAVKMKDRKNFLFLWMILGVASSIASTMIDFAYVPNVVIMSLFLGVSFGIGMPSCMGQFAENVGIGNRGRAGGITLLLSGLGMVALGIITGENIKTQTFILSAWRISGLILFALFWRLGNKNETDTNRSREKNRPVSYKSLFRERQFTLYLIPWIMFSLITYLTTPIQVEIIGKSAVELMFTVENALMAVFAVVGGFLADRVGRKLVAIQGFVLLGLGYSVLGIFGNNPENLFSWFFYTAVDGIAWGLLFVIFVITVWGDLGHSVSSDKHYAIGVLPFFISKFLQLTIGTNIADVIPRAAIFSFTALFLFLAVLPLVYAPETLPEKTMKDRELKIYIEQAQKIKQKLS